MVSQDQWSFVPPRAGIDLGATITSDPNFLQRVVRPGFFTADSDVSHLLNPISGRKQAGHKKALRLKHVNGYK
jgi:hypothetical protein